MEDISKRISNLSPAKKKLLELRMKQQKAKNQQLKQEAKLELKPIPRTEKLPLSLIQEGIWDIEQLQPGISSFNLPISCRLVGDLNQEILEKSINEIVKRHEALRTCFDSENGQQFQKTLPSLSLNLPVIDLQTIADAERKIAQQKIAFEEASQPFDLKKAPLLRIKLLILQEQEHLLLVTMHHGVADIWSLGIFLQELPIIYQAFLTNKPYILPELPIQYADFVYWQKKSLQGTKLEKQLTYWKQKLGNVLPLKLPVKDSQIRDQIFQGSYEELNIAPHLVKKLRELSKQQGVTLFMILLAAFNILLSLYTEQEEISVRSPILNRNHVETETLIGAFAIPLILSTKVSPEQTFAKLLSEVREGTLGAYSHPEMPLNYNLLSSVLFDFMKEPTDVITLPNLRLEIENKLATLTIGGVDLFSYLAEVKDQEGLYWALGYNRQIFSSETIKELMSSYLQIIETCVNNSNTKISQFSLSNKLKTARNLNAQQIAIASTFTAEPLADSLSFWMKQLDIPSDVKFAAFNQVFQELLKSDSLLTQNKNGVNIILVRLQDWLSNANIEQKLLANGQQLVTAIKSNLAATKVPHILVLCPNSLENSQKYQAIFNKVESEIKAELETNNGVYLLTSTDLTNTYPVENYEDRHADQQGSIPFTPAFYTALGTQVARKINVIKSNPYKVIVLDCDRTLWDGICGEDGISEIQITEPYRFVQEFMVAQHDTGKLICLCSKNNTEDVEAVWQYHSMPLKDEYIIAKRINWQVKSENLKSLAKELNLDLNSFIFIDDNPVECAEVQVNCPEVLTIQLPKESEKIPQFLQHIWAFDWLQITKADEQRTKTYKDNIKRESYREKTLTLADFITGLDLQINITPIKDEEIARVSQLTQRTNQFNLTTIRYSPEDIQRIYESEREQCLVVKVCDRFGDYGLVGAIIFEINNSILKVNNLMLSCRAFGKGVEHQMLAHLGKIALEARINQINLPYIPTAKNQPALNFLETIGSELKQGDNFNFSAEFASNIIYQPENNQTLNSDKTSNISNHKQSRTIAPFARIATELVDVENIHQAIQLQKHQARPNINTNYVLPQTQTEQILAEIVAKILNLESVGINDDFFELGGSSMLAVQFISEVNKVFKIELSLLTLFQATTIAKFAQIIDIKDQPTNQNTTIDWDAEAILDSSIHPQTPSIKTIEQPKAIFLTGATGFLGAFLLHDLIKETSADIYCLVRANNALKGKQKLQKNLEKYSLYHEEFNHRIIALPGNLAKPYIGLSPEEFEIIARKIDVIYHNGAAVNFIYPYEQLKAANVKGTEEILRLASHLKDKPVHFVSTIGIFQAPEGNNNLIKETDNPSNPQAIQGGYFQSKWVAEKLVKNAFDRGMIGCIYRLGAVAGESKTGIGNTDDAMSRMLKGFTEMRKAPKIDFAIDLIPVDYVSQGIVYLSQQEESLGKTFHFCQQKPISLNKLIDFINFTRYKIEKLPFEQWRSEMITSLKADTTNELFPFIPLLQSYSAENIQAISKLKLDSTNTHRILKNVDIICPPLDKLLKIYFSYFANIGFLKLPE